MGPTTGVDERARRKRLGSWYTPVPLVDHLVAVTGASVPPDGSFTVLDPSCGDGAFLAGVRRAFGERALLMGVDIDPAAVRSARSLLPGAEIVETDALAHDWGDRRFDLVIGNPPFLNQMARATTRGGRSRFGGGPYADTAAVFLALATSLARPGGGRVGLVLPQSVLTTRDAGPIREAVAGQAAVMHAWWSTTQMFDAAVHTCAVVIERDRAQADVTRTFGPTFSSVASLPASALGRSWGALVVESGHLTSISNRDGRTLGDIASFTVDFRDQYYGLVGAVSDDAFGPPLVTCGLIEPGACRWGERPVRFAKQRFAAPRVDLGALSPKLQRWAAQRLVPKILVANQTRTIEAVIDHDGAWLPSVPVITCVSDQLTRVHAVLSSAAATDWARHHAAGSGLSPTSMRLTPALLAGIPLPDPLAT